MSFQVKFQLKIRQKCRSKWNDIGHTLELGGSGSQLKVKTIKYININSSCWVFHNFYYKYTVSLKYVI